MAQPEKIAPVKLFIGCIYKTEKQLLHAKDDLEAAFGPVDFESTPFSFSSPTHYYEKEMGQELLRKFYSFKSLIDPVSLSICKTKAFEIEQRFLKNDNRQINLDPGYIDFNKVVLASFKYASHKIHIGNQVWADLTLFYEKGRFKSFPWTFPDFREDRYYKTLFKIRELLKKDWRKCESLEM